MPSEDIHNFSMSGTALSAPQVFASNNTAEVSYLLGGSLDVPSVGDGSEVMAHLRGKVFRVMDDQLFLVDPGSPPAQPTTP